MGLESKPAMAVVAVLGADLVLPPPLLQKDYPNVQFWDKASYTQYLNNSRKNNTARNRPGQKYPEDVNASQQYIEDENGNIVSGQTAKTAREAMSTLFFSLSRSGYEAAKASQLTHEARTYIHYNMSLQFPCLQLCERGWKISELASQVHQSWKTNHNKIVIPAAKRLKMEMKEEKQEIVMETVPRAQSIASSSTSGTVRKRRISGVATGHDQTAHPHPMVVVTPSHLTRNPLHLPHTTTSESTTSSAIACTVTTTSAVASSAASSTSSTHLKPDTSLHPLRVSSGVGGYPGSYDDTLASTDLDLDSVMTPAIARSSSHGGTTEATTGADKEHFMDVDEEFVPPHIQDTFPPLPLDQYRADQTSQTPDSTTESETRTTESESASGLLMSPVAVASSSSQLDQEMEQPQPEAITGSAQLKPSLITVHKPLRSSSRIQDLLLTTATSEPEDTLDSQPEPEDLQATATASGSNDSHSNKPDSRVGPTASSSKLPLIGAPATGTAGLGPCKPKGKPATVKAVTKHKANARISVQSLCLEKFLARDPDGLWRDFQVEFKNLSADETKELEAECQIRRAKAASAKASS